MSDTDHLQALLRTGYWGRRAAGVLFQAPSKRVGLALRSEFVQEPNTYGLVGGAVESNEDPRRAVVREVWEELGWRLTASKLEPLDVFRDGTFAYYTFLYRTNAERTVSALNQGTSFEENTSFEWFDLDELPDNLHPGLAQTLNKAPVLRRLA